jgi:hypothetical protein
LSVLSIELALLAIGNALLQCTFRLYRITSRNALECQALEKIQNTIFSF